MTDGIADLFTQIRNGSHARHEQVKIPYSKFKEQVARILKQEGYVGEIGVVDENGKKKMVIDLRYTPEGESVINQSKRMSRPGCRKYVGQDEIPLVASGLGISILSTSKGVMSSREASEKHENQLSLLN